MEEVEVEETGWKGCKDRSQVPISGSSYSALWSASKQSSKSRSRLPLSIPPATVSVEKSPEGISALYMVTPRLPEFLLSFKTQLQHRLGSHP